jgi:hypothetical protein
MSTTAGYSQTTLAKKLGIKEGFKMRILHAPDNYFKLFTDFPDNVILSEDQTIKKDLIHYFSMSVAQLQNAIPALKEEIEPNGMIWVSWPKKASKVPTDITEDIVRQVALENGLVDIKVCAVDTVWSGLKLVIPVKNRTK